MIIIKAFKFNEANNRKLNKILCSAQNEFYNMESNPIKLLINCDKIQEELFIFDKSLIDISNISERASNELCAVAYLFKIYDKQFDKSSLISKFPEKDLIKFPMIAMIARAFNIVEIAPIIDEVILHYSYFEQDEGSDPTLKELMGMHSATTYVLPPKEQNRHRTKIIQLKNNETKSKEKKIENIEKTDSDSYYSLNDNDDDEKCDSNGNDQNSGGDNNNNNDDNNNDDDDEYEDDNDLFNIYLLHSKVNSTLNPLLNLIFKEKVVDTKKYEKLRISEADIIIIRGKFKIGHSTWISDTWKVFIYCFNLRLQAIGIKFDLEEKNDDKRFKASIDKGIQIVLKFYPLPRINDFWKNKKLIENFLWNHREHSKEIIRAFIRSFDDADRIVTPLYMGKKTYHDRTPEDLKIIYEY